MTPQSLLQGSSRVSPGASTPEPTGLVFNTRPLRLSLCHKSSDDSVSPVFGPVAL